MIAIREDICENFEVRDPFETLLLSRERFLSGLGLPTDHEITTKEAIEDLEKRHGTVMCREPEMSNFLQGKYGPITSKYQQILRRDCEGNKILEGVSADSHRFVNHRSHTEQRFRRILAECRPGMNLSDEQREQIGIGKRHIALLSADEACHTLTSLPDDLIHYAEPRIMTVREYARIQSFPDWFEFKSNYTTGSTNRREQVPRYTQVANAVPPLLAQALGVTLLKLYEELATHQSMHTDLPILEPC